MNMDAEQDIRRRTAALVLDWHTDAHGPFRGERPEEFMPTIAAAHIVADEARLGLHRWVDAGRRSGLSWADIGGLLGISKQAAQQRFRPEDVTEDVPEVEDRIVHRTGATAFNEVSIMEEEGRRGRELVHLGVLSLAFRQTAHRWEHRRVVGIPGVAESPMQDLLAEGWTPVGSWFCFHYFKRPLPAAP